MLRSVSLSFLISTIGKEARRLKIVHFEELSDKGSTSLTEIERFEQMTRSLTKYVERIKKGVKVNKVDLRQMMVWLAESLMHCNAQRTGAVTMATLEEFHATTVSTIGRESYKTILVSNHKTATTRTAKMTANSCASFHKLDLFVHHIRTALEGNSSTMLFPNREGRPLNHLSRHVNKLANELGFQLPPTATATRHTAAAGSSERERGCCNCHATFTEDPAAVLHC